VNQAYLAEIGVSDRFRDWQDTAAELQMEHAE